MKERGILFSDVMVRALLDGTKTQTRRLVKWEVREPGLNLGFSGLVVGHYCTGVPSSGWVLRSRGAGGCWNDRTQALHCPYGVPGDRLWVREAHAFVGCSPGAPGAMAWGTHNIRGGDFGGEIGCGMFRVHYAASGDERPEAGDRPGWRPSIFMPRWASRITLEITAVRVERLKDITPGDAQAEGVRYENARDVERRTVVCPLVDQYAELWDDINGSGAWAKNPWVFAISFKRVVT